MIRVILLILVLINISYADAKKYYIKLGSFRHLNVLEHTINRLPQSLRSHIVIIYRPDGWYIPFAYHTTKKYALMKKMPSYRRYFPDAQIRSSSAILRNKVVRNYVRNVRRRYTREKYTNISSTPRVRVTPYRNIETYKNDNIVSSYTPTVVYDTAPIVRPTSIPIAETIPIEETIPMAETIPTVRTTVIPTARTIPIARTTVIPTARTIPIARTTVIPTARTIPIAETIPIPEYEMTITKSVGDRAKGIKRYKYFNKRMLSGHHYYLAYKSTRNSPNLLVKVTFNNHDVIYEPIIGNMDMNSAKYVVKDRKLYMFADTFSKDGAFSKIEGNARDYILVSSWYNGKKLNTLRYYYNLNDAKKYLGEKEHSDSLATALEDGEFDRLHQAFEGVEGIYIGGDDSY